MRGRPGRVLPSLIVGGLLAGGLVLGTGVATAADGDSCTYLGQTYLIAKYSGLVANGKDCGSDSTKSVAEVLGLSTDTSNPAGSSPPASIPPVVPPVVTDPSADPKPVGDPKPGVGTDSGRGHGHGHSSTKQSSTAGTSQPGSTVALPSGGLPPVAGLPAGGVVAPPAALPGLPLAPGLPGLGLPAGFAPTALAGGSLPGGLSSGLFGANLGAPGLLAGTPLGAAAASLYQPQADSAVTTVSHSEALAPGAQRGIGTPTAVAAIALACVVGILVRSRVLRRIARRELAAGYPLTDDSVVDPGTVDPGTDDPADHDHADELAAVGAPLLAA